MFDGDCAWWDFGCATERPWVRLGIKLVLFYAFVAFCCWSEVRYRSAVELTADIELVRPHIRKRNACVDVRYTFRDPETGERRGNTVTIPEDDRPSGTTAVIQYLPGDSPESRLAVQARPWMMTVFVATNCGLLAIVVGYVGYLAWEFHHDPLRRLPPQQRGLERFARRRMAEREWRSKSR